MILLLSEYRLYTHLGDIKYSVLNLLFLFFYRRYSHIYLEIAFLKPVAGKFWYESKQDEFFYIFGFRFCFILTSLCIQCVVPHHFTV